MNKNAWAYFAAGIIIAIPVYLVILIFIALTKAVF